MLGAVEGEVASFRGLAYAAPPIGALRWRPPQTMPESSEMRIVYDYGAPCLQLSLPGASEDCLTLNVFRPFGVDGPLPVMVFIMAVVSSRAPRTIRCSTAQSWRKPASSW